MTLTVAAGVNFRFVTPQGLKVDGTLRTLGTESERVAFTYANDIGVGGQTSLGGDYATAPWDRIDFNAGSTADLTHTNFIWTERAHEIGNGTGNGTVSNPETMHITDVSPREGIREARRHTALNHIHLREAPCA